MNSSIPPPREEPGTKPLSSLGAGLWTLGATFGFIFILGLWASGHGNNEPYEIGRTLCQIGAYAFVLYSMLQRYGDGSGAARFFAVRSTSAGYYAIATLLGLSASMWINALLMVIVERFPTQHFVESDDHALTATLPWKIGCGICLVFAGPLVEELFFRGALFGTLRRAQSALNTVVITSLLFAMSHIVWQAGVPLLPLALASAVIRQWSGSLVPSLLLHMSFNGVAFAAMMSPRFDATFSAYISLSYAHGAVIVGSMVVSALCIFVAYLVSSAAGAQRARALDA